MQGNVNPSAPGLAAIVGRVASPALAPQPLASPELTMLSWPSQVDSRTEENDMNKRRRKGFNNLDEVRVLSVSLHKGLFPDSQWPQPTRLTEAVSPPVFEPLGAKLSLMGKQSGLVTSYVTLPGCGSCL